MDTLRCSSCLGEFEDYENQMEIAVTGRCLDCSAEQSAWEAGGGNL